MAALVWPAGALIPRGYERRYRKQLGERVEKATRGAGEARLARLVAWLVCVLALLFSVGVVSVSSNAEENLFYGTSLLRLSLVGAALTVGVLVYAALARKRGYWGAFGRLYYSAVALSALTFVALLAYYNLLGFRF